MANVSLQNITKVYEPANRREQPVTAVNDVSLEVRDGEFLVLVGPSGCGKSTTLRMIAGLETITRGTLHIGDRQVNNVPPKDRDIAMVFQNYALYPHMTVFDNMAFGLKLRKFSRDEIQTRVNEAAEILGIAELLQRKPRALSGGQRQRVALGRAIVRKPAVFLFDEPLSNLDAKMRVQMRTEISRLHKRLRATMIYVTHDQVEAMTMGDRIAVMKDGVVHQVDTPLALYNQPVNAFVAGFLGSPPMNLIPGTAHRDGDTTRFTEKNGPLTLDITPLLADPTQLTPNTPLLLGIRPEDIVHLQEPTPDIPKNQLLQATLELAEPLGAETNLYVSTGTHALVCRRPGVLASLEEGQRVLLRLDPGKIQLFDAKTGERLGQTVPA